MDPDILGRLLAAASRAVRTDTVPEVPVAPQPLKGETVDWGEPHLAAIRNFLEGNRFIQDTLFALARPDTVYAPGYNLESSRGYILGDTNMQRGRDIIRLFQAAGDETYPVLLHEVGHLYDKQRGQKSPESLRMLMERYDEFKQYGKRTSYNTSTPVEYFAEMFRLGVQSIRAASTVDELQEIIGTLEPDYPGVRESVSLLMHEPIFADKFRPRAEKKEEE